MNNKAIYFIGGFIWALVSSRKAYAPNINTSIDNSTPNVEVIKNSPPLANRECPEGQYKSSIICTTGMDAGSIACSKESKRLGGFRCVEDNRPKSQADCTDINKPFFHYYPKSADSRQLGDEMTCASVPQGSFNSKGIIVQE